MILGKAFGTAVSIGTTALGGAAIAPAVSEAPVSFDLLGVLVPVVPVCVGLLTSLLVRIIVITKGQKELWYYNLCVTALCMLAAAVTITDHKMGPGTSMWIGGGFGAAGVLIIEIWKGRLLAMLGARAEEARRNSQDG